MDATVRSLLLYVPTFHANLGTAGRIFPISSSPREDQEHKGRRGPEREPQWNRVHGFAEVQYRLHGMKLTPET